MAAALPDASMRAGVARVDVARGRAPVRARRDGARRRRATRGASGARGATEGGRDDDVSVVIVPGFLSSAAAYDDLAREIIARGHASTTIVPFRAVDWWPTLAGGAFDGLLETLDACVRGVVGGGAERRRVVLVAHSAGGWICRLWMGSKVRYCGRATPYAGAKHVRALITLGSPHSSAEAYPFGRIPEKRPGEKESMSDAARGSSLVLTNEMYPGAYEPGVKYVAVAGELDYVGAETFDVVGALRDRNKTISQAWRDYVAGVSYKANTGDNAEVVGDGVCPVDVAALEGAENIRVRCHHSPNSSCEWYGSPNIINEWIKYIS